jgi:hypothetical protein
MFSNCPLHPHGPPTPQPAAPVPQVYERAAHVDTTLAEHYSIVFDKFAPGREIARFVDEHHHRRDAEFFIAACVRQAQVAPDAQADTREQEIAERLKQYKVGETAWLVRTAVEDIEYLLTELTRLRGEQEVAKIAEFGDELTANGYFRSKECKLIPQIVWDFVERQAATLTRLTGERDALLKELGR